MRQVPIAVVCVSIMVMLLIACGGPSGTDIQATIQAGVTQTQEAQSTPIPAVTTEGYKAAVAEQIGIINDSLAAFTKLLSQGQPSDKGWRMKVDEQLTAIRKAHARLEQLAVPRSAESVHKALLDATGDCDSAAKLIEAGLDGDNNAMQLATTELSSCGNKMADAALKVQVFEEQ